MAVTLAPGLERRLKSEVKGDVWFDPFTRGRYATDASHYQIMPLGVAGAALGRGGRNRATATARVSRCRRAAAERRRAARRSTILVVDCSKYLNRILDLDVTGRRCMVEPGIVLDDLNRQLKAHGLWFPVDISTGLLRHSIGGIRANNSCGARSFALRCDPRQRARFDAVLADGAAGAFRSSGAAGLRIWPGPPARSLRSLR